jgi:hypothetical protein
MAKGSKRLSGACFARSRAIAEKAIRAVSGQERATAYSAFNGTPLDVNSVSRLRFLTDRHISVEISRPRSTCSRLPARGSPPRSGWNDGDARDYICGPFLGGLIRPKRRRARPAISERRHIADQATHRERSFLPGWRNPLLANQPPSRPHAMTR